MTQNSPALPKFEIPISVNGTTNKNWYFFFQSLLSTTITSVGFDSVDLTVNGSPLVAAGVINANLKVQPLVHPGFYPAANVTVNNKGIVTAISSGGSGGGGSFITSVAVTSTDLAVTGSPVIAPSGVIDLELTTQGGITPGSYTNVNLTVNGKGVITAVANGAGSTNIVTKGATWVSSSGAVSAASAQLVFVDCPAVGTIKVAKIVTVGGPGSCVIDIWKAPFASFPPTVANTITAAALPTIVAGTTYSDSTLTGWTTAVNVGDILAFKLNSSGGFTQVTIYLEVQQ